MPASVLILGRQSALYACRGSIITLRSADLVGGGSEAAFLWDQLLDGVLNGPTRARRTVSVEDGHMVALPDSAPDTARAVGARGARAIRRPGRQRGGHREPRSERRRRRTRAHLRRQKGRRGVQAPQTKAPKRPLPAMAAMYRCFDTFG